MIMITNNDNNDGDVYSNTQERERKIEKERKRIRETKTLGEILREREERE